MTKSVFQEHLDRINKAAGTAVPEWHSLPKSDPMRTMAGFTALVSSDVESKLESLDQLILSRLPAIFGVAASPAKAAMGFLGLSLEKGLKSDLQILNNSRLTIKLSETEGIEFHTRGDHSIFDYGGVDVVHEPMFSLIGFEKLPSRSFSFFVKPTGHTHVTSLSCEWLADSKSHPIKVDDQTNGFSEAGLVTVNPPSTKVKPRSLGSKNRYWLRIDHGVENQVPFRAVEVNVVPITNGRLMTDVFLGSGSGAPNQRFELPPGQLCHCERLKIYNAATDEYESWQRVDTMLMRAPTERVFRYDQESHSIVLGDGKTGACSTPGYDNIWIESLELCNGARANIDAEAEVEFTELLPGLDRTRLLERTKGGEDYSCHIDLTQRLQDRLDNADRAITLQDFETLASRSTNAVGKCFARLDESGSVVVTPILPKRDKVEASEAPRPDLLHTVKQFLDKRRSVNTKLLVEGIRYRDINVMISMTLSKKKDVNLDQIQSSIAEYFCPYSHGAIKPGAVLAKEEFKDYTGMIDTVANINSIVWHDASTGQDVDQLHLSMNELPRPTIRLNIEDARWGASQ